MRRIANVARATRHPANAVAVALTLLLGGCNEVRMPGVYRIDLQQGNVITQGQLAALEKGMEKRKVLFILGTPLVTDAFNQNRWDYYYSLEKRGEDRVQRVLSVFFENERLVRVSGDVRPASGPIVVEQRKDEVVTVPEGYRDDGLLASLTPDFMSGRPKRQPRPDAPGTAADVPAQTTRPAAETTPVPPVLEIGAEDERYLRDLLEGFGSRRAPDAPAAAPESASPTPSPAGNAGDEGILSRWARRLGLKDEAPPPERPAQPAPPALPPVN